MCLFQIPCDSPIWQPASVASIAPKEKGHSSRMQKEREREQEQEREWEQERERDWLINWDIEIKIINTGEKSDLEDVNDLSKALSSNPPPTFLQTKTFVGIEVPRHGWQ